MKRSVLLSFFVVLQAGTHKPENAIYRSLRVQRVIQAPGGATGAVCAVLDGDVYAHAASASLSDVRLLALGSDAEIPFTLTESNTEGVDTEAAIVRKASMHAGTLTVDLKMPSRAYTAVEIQTRAGDFVGSATVWGGSQNGRLTTLGTFTLFDLSRQHLSRSTTLALEESSFPSLHLEMHLRPALGEPRQSFDSGFVTGALVPPSRQAQTLYTTVAEAHSWIQSGHESVAKLRLPAHIPVARLRVSLDPAFKTNFLRELKAVARRDSPDGRGSSESVAETVEGSISQVHFNEKETASGLPALHIADQQVSLDAVLAANLHDAVNVDVSVENGTDEPLPLRAAELQMRQRKVCFVASPGVGRYILMYGGRDIPAPSYGDRLSIAGNSPGMDATLGPEERNPQFTEVAEKAKEKPLLRRYPEVWLILVGMFALFGSAVLRGLRHQRGAWL